MVWRSGSRRRPGRVIAAEKRTVLADESSAPSDIMAVELHRFITFHLRFGRVSVNKLLMLLALAMTLILLMACGGEAEPTSAPTAAPSRSEPVATEAPASRARPAPTSAPAADRARPAPTSVPAPTAATESRRSPAATTAPAATAAPAVRQESEQSASGSHSRPGSFRRTEGGPNAQSCARRSWRAGAALGHDLP